MTGTSKDLCVQNCCFLQEMLKDHQFFSPEKGALSNHICIPITSMYNLTCHYFASSDAMVYHLTPSFSRTMQGKTDYSVVEDMNHILEKKRVPKDEV